MNVRTIIAVNRGRKWSIDGRFYKHEMYIPEIVRDKKINSYKQQGDTIIVVTKEIDVMKLN